jgi:hypothetical protein
VEGLDRDMLMRRRANVESAGMLRPHDHAVWFGDGSAELYAMASEALAEGVRRNEKLMFVASDPDTSLLQGFAARRLIEDGQLEIVDVEAAYGGGTDFSAGAQLATFQRVLDDALAEGYSGIRVVADNTSLAQGDDESFARWLAWEQLTDHFQADSLVTGICFFDASAISAERLADLAALHPMRMAAGPVEPAFTLFVDRDAVLVIGSLSSESGDQLRRLLAAIDFEQKPVVDLSAAQLVDNQALLTLAALASAVRPLVLRGNDHLRARVASLGPAGARLRVERTQGPAYRCAGCGDVIGVYERASVLFADATHSTSPLAEPEVVDQAAARFHSECYAAA